MSFDRRPFRLGPALAGAALAAGLLVLPSAAGAQTVDGESVTDRLTVLAEDNASEYLLPVAAGLGAGLNSGFFQSAGSDDGIHVHAGLQVSGSLIPDDADTFAPILPGTFTFRDRTFEDPYVIQGARTTTPTAAGAGNGAVLEPSAELDQAIRDAGEDPADYEIRFPDGVDLPAVPLVMGEASVQLPTGTGVMARFLPRIDVSPEVGSISSYGFGVRQSVTTFLQRPPVDVAVAAGYQSLSLGDVVDASGTSLDLIVSKDLDLITVFASGGIEGSSVDVTYTFDSPTDISAQPADGETISFPREGESYPGDAANSGRFTGGVQLNLFVARVSLSYTSSTYDVLQARLSFGS